MPWRNLIASHPAVAAALERIPAERRYGSVLTFSGTPAPRGGDFRLPANAALARLDDVSHATRINRRVYITPTGNTWHAEVSMLRRLTDGVHNAKRLYGRLPAASTQDTMLAFVRSDAEALRELAAGGMRLLVPVLPGPRPLSAAYRATCEALKPPKKKRARKDPVPFRDFVAVVPASVTLEQLEDLAREEPAGIHLSGTATQAQIATIRRVAPPVAITADAVEAPAPLAIIGRNAA